MNVLILAGGKGLRLRPYTTVLPKPLMPLGEKPIMERIINQLKNFGYRKIYISVGYLSSLIMAYFGDGKKFGVEIEYVVEEKPLGTAGPISLLSNINEPFLVLNGDLVTNLDFRKIYEYHINNKAFLTIGVHRLTYQIPLGFLDMTNNIINNYIEKPEKKYNVSMGVYVCSSSVAQMLNVNEKIDFPDLTKKAIRKGEKVIGYENNADWIDVGRPEEYEKALKMFKH